MKICLPIITIVLACFLVSACGSTSEAPECNSPEVQKGGMRAMEQGIVAAGGVVGMISSMKDELQKLTDYGGEDAEDAKRELRRKLNIKSAGGIRICRSEFSPGAFLVIIVAVSPESDDVGYMATNFGLRNAVGYYGWLGD